MSKTLNLLDKIIDSTLDLETRDNSKKLHKISRLFEQLESQIRELLELPPDPDAIPQKKKYKPRATTPRPNGSKKCGKCGKVLPYESFYHRNGVPTGSCKTCSREATRARARRYNKSQKGAATRRRYLEKKPFNYNAYNRVHRALAKGNLPRPQVCSECKKRSDSLVCHHYDYSKPLDVIWVCRSCHWEIHNKQRQKQKKVA